MANFHLYRFCLNALTIHWSDAPRVYTCVHEDVRNWFTSNLQLAFKVRFNLMAGLAEIQFFLYGI